jgi:hypothetical protein
MIGHVKVLGWIGLVRALLGAALGVFLLWRASDPRVLFEAAPGDVPTFQVVGALLVACAALWALQAIAALRVQPWARPVGIVLAIADVVNLVFFPVSTALGLYALVTFRNPETAAYFESQRGGRAPERRPHHRSHSPSSATH